MPRKKPTERGGVMSRAVRAVQTQAMKMVGSQSPKGRAAIGSLGEDDENTQPVGTQTSGGMTSPSGKVIPVVPMLPLERKHRDRDDNAAKKNKPSGPQKTCVGENCKKRQKSGRYLRKPGSTEEEYLCFTCWAKEHVKNAGRQCFICDKTNAGGCWYKSKLHKDKDLCTRCYERERRDRLQASGNLKCWCCGALTTSAKWRTSKDKSEGKKDLCNKCYLKECRATKTAMETGKSCCVCRTQITTVWKQSTVSKGPDGKTDICYQCHRREPGQAALE